MKLIGIEHRKGFSSKTQKDYDFYTLHCTFARSDCEGLATRQVYCSPDHFDKAKVSVGDEIIVDAVTSEIFKF